jgi:signal transduction histidine kinase
MKKILFCFATLFCLSAAYSQNTNLDSLKNIINNSNAAKLAAVKALLENAQSMTVDSLSKYAIVYKTLALQQKDEATVWDALYTYAYALSLRAKTDSSLHLADSLLTQVNNLDKNYTLYHKILELKTENLIVFQKYKEATQAAGQLMVSAQQYKDTGALIISYIEQAHSGGGTLNDYEHGYGKFRQEIEWYKKALSLTNNSNYSKKYSFLYLNLGKIYAQLPTPKFDSALYWINKGYNYAVQTNTLKTIGSTYGMKALIFSMMKRYDSSEYYFKKSLDFEKQFGNPKRVIAAYGGIIQLYKDRSDYRTALAWCDSQRVYHVQNNLPLDFLFYDEYERLLYRMGDYKKAVNMMDTIIAIKDSLYQANSSRDLAELQTKYDVQSKELTIKEQRLSIVQKNYWIYGSLALLVLLSIIGIIIFYGYKRKHRFIAAQEVTKARDAERRRIAADLHDNIGAKLSLIRNNAAFVIDRAPVITEAEEKKYLSGIDDIAKEAMIDLRETIWVLRTETITLQHFADKLKSYLHQQLSDKQNIEMDFKEKISEDYILSPHDAMHIFRIAQELIHNIIKHADAGKIDVLISNANANSFELMIKDNGNGFDTTLKKQNHYGLENIKERAEKINATFFIESHTGVGTKAVLVKK